MRREPGLVTSAPSHAAGAKLAVPAHEERTPASSDVTACMHEADLPKGRKIAFAGPVL